MRIIVDTNVVVSGFLAAGSTASRAFDKARATAILLFSTETAEELIAVLGRRKFDAYVPAEQHSQLLRGY